MASCERGIKRGQLLTWPLEHWGGPYVVQKPPLSPWGQQGWQMRKRKWKGKLGRSRKVYQLDLLLQDLLGPLKEEADGQMAIAALEKNVLFSFEGGKGTKMVYFSHKITVGSLHILFETKFGTIKVFNVLFFWTVPNLKWFVKKNPEYDLFLVWNQKNTPLFFLCTLLPWAKCVFSWHCTSAVEGSHANLRKEAACIAPHHIWPFNSTA